MMTPSDLYPVVDQTVWWEPARSQAMVDLEFFLSYAMAYATDEALTRIRRHATDDQLRAALRAAPIGLFDLQSWSTGISSWACHQSHRGPDAPS